MAPAPTIVRRVTTRRWAPTPITIAVSTIAAVRITVTILFIATRETTTTVSVTAFAVVRTIITALAIVTTVTTAVIGVSV